MAVPLLPSGTTTELPPAENVAVPVPSPCVRLVTPEGVASKIHMLPNGACPPLTIVPKLEPLTYSRFRAVLLASGATVNSTGVEGLEQIGRASCIWRVGP